MLLSVVLRWAEYKELNIWLGKEKLKSVLVRQLKRFYCFWPQVLLWRLITGQINIFEFYNHQLKNGRKLTVAVFMPRFADFINQK